MTDFDFAALAVALSAGWSVLVLGAAVREWRLRRAQTKRAALAEAATAAAHESVSRRVDDLKRRFETDHAHVLSQALVGRSAVALRRALREFLQQKFDRFNQELCGRLSEEIESVAGGFGDDLSERLWDAFQGFKECGRVGPYVFPDGVRVAYTKGRRTAVVVEQKPQVRTVSFTSSLVEVVGDGSGCGRRYTLAFPYVYFVVAFDGPRYAFQQVYFRNKPLMSMRELVCDAPLPNVGISVCMGDGFSDEAAAKGSIARQAEYAISQFWQSQFSADMTDEDFMDDLAKIDQRIRTYSAWQENTAIDPLFVLKVPWSHAKTMKEVIDRVFLTRPRKHGLDDSDQHLRNLIDAGTAKMVERVKAELEALKRKGASARDLDERALAMVEDVVVGHARQVFAACTRPTR